MAYHANFIVYQQCSPKGLKSNVVVEGSLEVNLPTICTDEKQSRKSEEKVRAKRMSKKRQPEKVRRQKMQVREKVGKSQNTVFSNDLWLWRIEK